MRHGDNLLHKVCSDLFLRIVAYYHIDSALAQISYLSACDSSCWTSTTISNLLSTKYSYYTLSSPVGALLGSLMLPVKFFNDKHFLAGDMLRQQLTVVYVQLALKSCTNLLSKSIFVLLCSKMHADVALTRGITPRWLQQFVMMYIIWNQCRRSMQDANYKLQCTT